MPGPPAIQIDWTKLDDLCLVGCTLRECAAILRCSEDTVERRIAEQTGLTFADYRDSKEASNRVELRRRQWDQAINGDNAWNVTDRIWMGKVKLGQTDKIVVEKDISPALAALVQTLVDGQRRITGEIVDTEYTALPPGEADDFT